MKLTPEQAKAIVPKWEAFFNAMLRFPVGTVTLTRDEIVERRDKLVDDLRGGEA